MGILQRLSAVVYPSLCLSCGAEVDAEQSFCQSCWPDAHFISGLICDSCGVPLPGAEVEEAVHCDGCLKRQPSWSRGRAVALYTGPVRRMALALKHGDRLDVAVPAARWMAARCGDLMVKDTLVIPVPLHWRRLLVRRYNQASELARPLAQILGAEYLPDGLLRCRATLMQKDMTYEDRQANLDDAIAVHPRHAARIADRPILLVDDVMTSGATLDACARTLLAAGAARVNTIVLARVAQPD